MAMRMGALSVLTLGIYRFWMKTRLRRYYWSAIRPGGHPMEYVGEPLEKLLGFFIAVVVLAFYIGIVNLVLMFISFSLFDGNYAAYLASFVGVIPIWFYARYRARRYVLARTRWRGIRFGVEPAAWGYAWRAMLLWALTIASATLFWPLMTFRLEKYRIDRTWYGDRQLSQGGDARMLVKGMIPVWIILAAGASVGIFVDPGEGIQFVVGFAILALPLLAIAFAWYSVRSFRLLTAHKMAGDIRFVSKASAPRVIGIYLLGYSATAILTGIAAAAVSFGWLIALFATSGEGFSFEQFDAIAAPGLPLQIVGFVIYFFVFVIWSALRHVFITMPLWRHYAETLEILDTMSLPGIRQRDRDEHREAEGFAEALDLGAAI